VNKEFEVLFAHTTESFDDLASEPLDGVAYVHKTFGRRPRVDECDVPTATGMWRTQRIGPFLSRGGNDWWTVLAADFGGFTSMLTATGANGSRSPRRIGLSAHFLAVVDAAGEPLGFPPIHLHHLGVVPSTPKGALSATPHAPVRPQALTAALHVPHDNGPVLVEPLSFRTANADPRFAHGTTCSSFGYCDIGSPFAIATLGDRQRSADVEGVEAADSMGLLSIDYGPTRAVLLGSELVLDSVLNDVRCHSPSVLAPR
jgi:hypothetical protein